MRRELLPAGAHLYRANLHMHTTVSDGRMTPEEVKAAYLQRGYSIVAFTDHDLIVPHNDLRDEHFLPITGCELAVTQASGEHTRGRLKTYHINLYAKDPEKRLFSGLSVDDVTLPHMQAYIPGEMREQHFPRDYSVACVNDLIARARAEGFLVSYNHPVWSLQSSLDWGELQGLWGIELYNTGAAQMGYIDTVTPMEELLHSGSRVYPLATDDAHRRSHCFGGWVTVAAPALEYGAVMHALEKGDFYASTGPEIYGMTLEDGILTVSSSPVVAAYLTTERRYTKTRMGRAGAPICEMRFDLNAYFEDCTPSAPPSYFRLMLSDSAGRQAWSRAYFADELI